MDMLRRYSESHHDEMILVTQDRTIEVAFSSVKFRTLGSVDQLQRKHEPKAVVLDRTFATAENLSWIRRSYPTSFLAVYDPHSSQDPCYRLNCFDVGVNMVAHDVQSLLTTLNMSVIPAGRAGGNFSCPYCQLGFLSEKDMWYHCPAFHINMPNSQATGDVCPICDKRLYGPLQVHIHHEHGPDKWSHTAPTHPDGATRLYNFSLVICRHPGTGKYLLCQEFANQGFWCPGGAVDAGELLSVAARRETLEEAGIDVELKGILSVEYNPVGKDHKQNNLVRLRVIYYAEPSALGLTQLPKSIPDFESVGACWCSAEEVCGKIKLRGSEPKRWVRYLQEGGAVFPLSLLEEKIG